MKLFSKLYTPPVFQEVSPMTNEKCVICGGDTGVPRSAPLKARERYVKGGGQLCRRCFYETYIKPDPEETLRPTDEEMEELLAMLQQP